MVNNYHDDYNELLDSVNTFADQTVAIENRPFSTFIRITLARPVSDTLEAVRRALCNMLDHNILMNQSSLLFHVNVKQLPFYNSV